jgi:hypothetical protein
LIERLLISNQVGLLEVLAGGGQCGEVNAQMTANRLVGVIAQALDIGDGDQEEVESQLDAITALDVVMPDKPVVDPIESGGDLAQAVRPQQVLFHELLTVLLVMFARGF